MARTAAAISRRLTPQVIVREQDAGNATAARAAAAPATAALGLADGALQPAAATPAATGAAPLEDLVARVGPAVVAIETSTARGSGFFVQSDTVITNAHVAGSEVSVRIHLVSGDTVTARVERVAGDIDLAVLKLSSPLPNQAVVPLGDVAHVRTGEDVVAIGSPLGVFQNSVTRGIVSAVRTNGTVTLIQTDAAINRGNSGGPLIDRNGMVIGINTMSTNSAQGISFAVAADHARELLSGSHVATTNRTPVAAMNETLAGTSSAEHTRAQATQAYEQALARVSRRADEFDNYWRRFRQQCYEGKVAGTFDREWFSLFEPKAMQGAVSPGCGSWWDDARTEAYTIRNTVEGLEEAARRADVYPGTRRDLRHKYRLDYAGWDR